MKRAGYEARERAHFDRLAETTGETNFARTTYAGALRMQRRAQMLAGVVHGQNCLEIGAGTGAFSEYVLAELPALELTISDISPKCIELAQTKITGRWPQVNFDVANCTELKYPDLSFDCVFGCSILHHLPLQPVLREIHRVLRPGGILWFSEPNMLNPQIAAQKHIRFIGKWLDDTEDETAYFRWPMARELVSAGFSNILVQPFDFLHPGTPRTVVRIVDLLANAAERVPLLREIAGSLVIQATKPR